MRLSGLALVLLAAVVARAADELPAVVSYVAADGVYVEVGADQGLRVGDLGVIHRDGVRIAEAEVIAVAGGSARLRILAGATGEPQVGDSILLRVTAPAEPDDEPEAPAGDAAPAEGKEPAEPFVPLLERQKEQAETARKSTTSHGRLSLRQVLHLDGKGDLDYWTTLLGARGGFDRIGGSPWALRWNGKVSLRGGDAYRDSVLEGARLDLFELTLGRRLESGGHLMLGRMVPRSLPAIGYIDGVQVETVLEGGLRVGGVAGFKPTRDDLTPSFDQPTVAGYATAVAGQRSGAYYSGTFGLLAGLYEGEVDRAALLLDQHVRSGPGLRLDAEAEIDFDVGAFSVREGVRLTRFDLRAAANPSRALTLRAGTDHWERLDNRAERARLPTPSDPYFDAGFWRYWVGAGYELTERWRLEGELAFIDGVDADFDPHWRITALWLRPFGLPGANLVLTVYNLEGLATDGVGGVLSGHFPLRDGRLMLMPSIGFRSVDASGEGLTVTDVGLRADYRQSARWSFEAGVWHSFGDALDSTRLEIGAVYRW